MVATKSRRRLVIPASLYRTAEELRFTRPWFMRSEGADHNQVRREILADSSPTILTFTNDNFITHFFSAAADKDDLEALNRFRDYAEPPEEMLDEAGQPLYPSSVARTTPYALAPLPQVLNPSAPGGFSELGDPLDLVDAVPRGRPALLRKLYLPLHEHFHVVTAELVCRRVGFPRVARERIRKGGIVVRRLMAEADSERWEDWLPVDEDHGVWVEIADAEMRPLGPRPAHSKPEQLDPAELWKGDFRGSPGMTGVRARLGIAGDDGLPTALASDDFSPIPASVGGQAAGKSGFFGYLPTMSSEQILPEVGRDVPAMHALAQSIAAQARQRLAAVYSNRVALRERIWRHDPDGTGAGPGLEELLQATVLLPRPDATTVTDAEDERARDWVDFDFTEQLFESALATLIPRILSDIEADAAPEETASDIWDAHAAEELIKAASATNQVWVNQYPDWGIQYPHLVGLLSTLFIDRAYRLIHDVWIEGAGSATFGPAQLTQLLLAALRRLRGFRQSLGDDLVKHIFVDLPPSEMPDVEAVYPDPRYYPPHYDPTYAPPNYYPRFTVSSWADSITAWLDAERDRPLRAPPWLPLSMASSSVSMAKPFTDADHRVAAHRAGIGLSDLLAAVDDEGSAAGSGYASVVRARTAAYPAGSALRAAGIALDEQPAKGLLVVPGLMSAADLNGFFDEVQAYYEPLDAATGLNRRRREAQGRVHTVRNRYDAESLYAVWTWVRVAGKTGCEREQIVWSSRSEPFAIAEPADVLGSRPVAFQLPNLRRLVRDIPRIPKARAVPFAAVTIPRVSGVQVGKEVEDTSRDFGLSMICSYGIPVFTICAWVAFQIVFNILKMIPGFMWLPLLKFCIPLRTKD